MIILLDIRIDTSGLVIIIFKEKKTKKKKRSYINN